MQAPELILEGIDEISDEYARVRVHFRYASDLMVKVQAYQQINPVHFTCDNRPAGTPVPSDARRIAEAKVRRRGRLLTRTCEADIAAYVYTLS
jgi:hypothetical protein